MSGCQHPASGPSPASVGQGPYLAVPGGSTPALNNCPSICRFCQRHIYISHAAENLHITLSCPNKKTFIFYPFLFVSTQRMKRNSSTHAGFCSFLAPVVTDESTGRMLDKTKTEKEFGKQVNTVYKKDFDINAKQKGKKSKQTSTVSKTV